MDVMDDAIKLVSERWLTFCNSVPCKAEVPLVDRITAFSFPMIEGLRETFPSLRDAPEGAVFIFIVKGIERSGTYPAAEIYDALGMPPLPG